MKNKRDYYEVLEIDKNATTEEIKKSFRRLAKQYHPDVNKDPSAEEKFKEINEAYEVLSNQQKRAQYDRFGHNANNFGGGFEGFSNGFDFGNMHDLDDIINQMFGGFGGGFSKRQSQHQTIQTDLDVLLKISFIESIKGADKKISYVRKKTCTTCHGVGSENKDDVKKCTTCHGSGRVFRETHTAFGVMRSEQECRTCDGSGSIIENKCKKCKGRKYIDEEVTLTVSIPSGVESGDRLTVSNKGNEIGNSIGNLFIHLEVKPSKFFQRKDNDIYTVAYIDPLLVIVGGKTKVVSPYGEVEIDIPANTSYDDKIRVAGHGVKNEKRKSIFGSSSSTGNLYVIVKFAKLNHMNKSDVETLKNIVSKNGFNEDSKDWNNKVLKEIK